MKQFYLIVCIALLINTQTQAQTTQDTIYFWKGGVLNLKKSIKAADLDSITFKRPTVVVPIATVTIGTQTWTTKNLDVATYSDGTVIPQVTDQTEWEFLTTGAWCYINNDSSNGTTYGKLYNWYAVAGIHDNDPNTPNKKLAPTGYHIPSDDEWTTLTTFLGGGSVGGKMKATGISLWAIPNTAATNSSGFTGLPGGCRCGPFGSTGYGGFWWSSTEYHTPDAWYRSLFYYSHLHGGSTYNKNYGFSVRCLVGEPAVVAVVPTITTTAVSSIGTITASSGGVITADGGASVTQRGLVWSTATNPSIVLSTKTQNGTGTGTYTSALSGLIANTTYYVRAYATNSAGKGYGAEVSFATLPPAPTEVVIGTQTWTTKNLDLATYSDGTIIPEVTDPDAWGNLTTGAWCYYNNEAANGATYGKLYNWYAVAGIWNEASKTDASQRKKLAPTGYHIPSYDEWYTLTTSLGGETVAGGKMKATGTSLWPFPNQDATNSSGFSGLPGGYRYILGTFSNIGKMGSWWSSSEDDTSNAWNRNLYYAFGYANGGSNYKTYGFSVRCLVGEPAVVAVAPTIIGMLAVSSIGTTTASSGGAITADGGAAISARGVVWSTSTNPTIDLSTKTEDGTGTGTYTSALSGLIANTTYYVRAYATNSAGTGYGAQLSFATLPPTEVVIGTQTWKTTNLDVATYSDGTVIPQVTDPTAWANLTTGAWCYYNNDSSNGTTYGKLYNWYAVAGIHDTDPNTPNKKLAPTGYHIPSDAEWTTLTDYLGGASVAGGKMKATGTSLWGSPNTAATNSSGFTALPGGYRNSNGLLSFGNIRYVGSWWSSSEGITTDAWYRALVHDNGSAQRINYYKTNGFSVRCLKD